MTAEEIVPVVDDHDRIVGSASISEVHLKGLLHREAYTYLINLKGQLLLQRRADNDLWDHSSAGHFSEKETYLDGAMREFSEELGIRLEQDEFTTLCYVKLKSEGTRNKHNNRFVTVFLVRKNIPIERFHIDEKEMSAVRYFDASEMKHLLLEPKRMTRSAKVLIEKYLLKLLT